MGCVHHIFPQTVVLRLRKISRGLPKDIVTAAQFTIFTLQLFQALTFSGGEPTITAPGIPLMLSNPDTQSLWRTVNATVLDRFVVLYHWR
ncbi:hypothetical protein SEEHRA36_20653 [Salmonella enterica subsp. enterica serovar Heidelberg str. SARA36]|nr:hypothetical protein SEEHRA36_20653 [Salmonella enterica subsp. enterica serovar Heidelberg str. SARA36]